MIRRLEMAAEPRTWAAAQVRPLVSKIQAEFGSAIMNDEK
jgi:hypothetical protein